VAPWYAVSWQGVAWCEVGGSGERSSERASLHLKQQQQQQQQPARHATLTTLQVDSARRAA